MFPLNFKVGDWAPLGSHLPMPMTCNRHRMRISMKSYTVMLPVVLSCCVSWEYHGSRQLCLPWQSRRKEKGTDKQEIIETVRLSEMLLSLTILLDIQ